jgi:hypothetical protein
MTAELKADRQVRRMLANRARAAGRELQPVLQITQVRLLTPDANLISVRRQPGRRSAEIDFLQNQLEEDRSTSIC